ncbi:MAG: transcription antitermination factor NusB [Firmicutes bacterium]|jgi:N utilization substance protein B|nr:transcription antitermination factor NusB [Bacillota bacterium]
MNRREARKNAFYLIFQIGFHQTEELEQMKELFFEQKEQEIPKEQREFILKEVEGTKAHLLEIDEIITKKSKKWKKERISKVDIAILRLAIYEIYFSEEVPNSVAINEAVELAKEFGTEQSPAFINGILGSIVSEKE